MPQRVTLPWQSEMHLAGKLVLSAAALLLLTLAYRFYKSRSFAGGKIPPADVGGEQKANGARDGDGNGDGNGAEGLRWRKGFGGEGRRGGGDGEGRGKVGVSGMWWQGESGLERGEEGEEGREVVSGLGLTSRREGTGRKGSELGSKLGSELGSELGSNLGSKLESKLGSELGSKLGSELASKSGNKLGIKQVSKPGSKLGNKLASTEESDPGNELGSDLESKPGSKLGSEQGSELQHKLASKPGSKKGSEQGSKLGSKSGSELASDLGSRKESELGSKLGSKLESELGSKLTSDPGSELGSELASKSGNELGIKQVSKPGSKLGNKLAIKEGSDPGNELGNKPGSKLESEQGSELQSKLGSKSGSEMDSSDPGNTAEPWSSHGEEDTLALSTGLPPGKWAGEGHTESTEQDSAVGDPRQKAEECWGTIQTLSIVSDLGLTMTTSNVGSDASYSFSSVAKIQVEENYIPEQGVRDGAGQPSPGLKGKVYDYYVQSISHSVSKKKSLPYIPPGILQHRSSDRVSEELHGSATQEPEPALVTLNPITSTIVPPPTESLEVSPEPQSPGRKDSILQIADSPHLQLPMEGFGVVAPALTPPASPQPGLTADANFFQTPPPTHLDLGNCYEVLLMAKAQKKGDLQEAAYKVMSDNYLQVLRTPSIYGRLNAGERELILRRRMKGKTHVAVADVNVQEPGLHTSRLCYYDDTGDIWHHLCHVPPEVVSRGSAMCNMFNYLFVAIGCEGTGRRQRPSNRVFCYNPLTNIWREICPLNQARPHCKLVALDGHLYAIGGECLYTVERYDPRQDRWTFAAPLPHDTFAVAHMATVCDGEIYVTGGTLRYVLLRYSARSDSWRVSLVGGGKDRTVEMVSTNGFIYRFDLHRSTGISVYRCGAKAKLWYECATYPMTDPSSFQCAVVGSLVHCVGRHFHVRFLADHISPRFGTKELQPFPSPRGSLLLAVLVLPEGGMVQTQV